MEQTINFHIHKHEVFLVVELFINYSRASQFIHSMYKNENGSNNVKLQQKQKKRQIH